MMKKILILICFLISISVNATIYYCSPTGNDSYTLVQAQNIATPWLTWHHAFNTVTASDTIYFRGGRYTTMYSVSRGAIIATTSISGTRSQPTCFFAYPSDWSSGNYPIFDCGNANSPGDYVYGVLISRASNLYFKGLTITNVPQFNANFPSKAWALWAENSTTTYQTNNIRFENCVGSYTEGQGFELHIADTVYIINCDAYMNCDSMSVYDAGGSGGGFSGGGPKTDMHTCYATHYEYYEGCRAWMNSDQGWAISGAGRTVFKNCWSINNGNFMLGQPKGSGWKFWPLDARYKDINRLQIEMSNCIAVDNAMFGINMTDRGDPTIREIRAHFYNNFFYRNGKTQPNTYRYGWGLADDVNTDTTGQYDHWHANNLSYNNWGGTPPLAYKHYPGDVTTGVFHGLTNEWDIVSTSITDIDFISLDTTGLCGTRQSSGELPITTFGTLASTSELIDAGTYIGIDYSGSAPDIGYVEYIGEKILTKPGYIIFKNNKIVTHIE